MHKRDSSRNSQQSASISYSLHSLSIFQIKQEFELQQIYQLKFRKTASADIFQGIPATGHVTRFSTSYNKSWFLFCSRPVLFESDFIYINWHKTSCKKGVIFLKDDSGWKGYAFFLCGFMFYKPFHLGKHATNVLWEMS